MKSIFWYGIIFGAVLVLDRITKLWALASCGDEIALFPFVSCELAFNRGISWGMFQAYDPWWFALQSSLIGGVLAFLSFYTIKKFLNNKVCWGEVLVIAGGMGNLLDRLWYGAVVDFILVSYGSHQFPTFNAADAVICLGVGFMLFEEYYDV